MGLGVLDCITFLEVPRLFWVALKVFCAGFGSVVAELLLKQESTLPFTVSFGSLWQVMS